MDSIQSIREKKKSQNLAVLVPECSTEINEQTGNLDCLSLIHARIPNWLNENAVNANGLEDMAKQILRHASKGGLRRIAMPLNLGCDFPYLAVGHFLAYFLRKHGEGILKHRVEILLCVTDARMALRMKNRWQEHLQNAEQNNMNVLFCSDVCKSQPTGMYMCDLYQNQD